MLKTKIIIIIILAAYVLAAAGNAYYRFDIIADIKINEDYVNANEAVPGGFTLAVGGAAEDGLIYLDLDDGAKILLDLLIATDIIGAAEKILFDALVEYGGGAVLCFEPGEADRYIKPGDDKFTVTDYNITRITDENKNADAKIFYFGEIKEKIGKELLKLPGYRYTELFIVMNKDENGGDFINILAAAENGAKKVLAESKLEADISDALGDPELIFGANIIPMRYIFELFGETVGWDAENGRAYITKNSKNIYFDRHLVNSRTYISLDQIMANTDYIISRAGTDGEYIEIIISRRPDK